MRWHVKHLYQARREGAGSWAGALFVALTPAPPFLLNMGTFHVGRAFLNLRPEANGHRYRPNIPCSLSLCPHLWPLEPLDLHPAEHLAALADVEHLLVSLGGRECTQPNT